MPKLCFSYDASTANEYTQESGFKRKLVEFLYREGAFNISSPVASTIYFETDEKTPLTVWCALIEDEFSDSFSYTLAKVHQYNSGKYAIKEKPKKSFVRNFKALLSRIKRKMWQKH